METPAAPAAPSALRALDLLALLARTGRAMTHAELAATLGVPKSSLTLLLRTLAERDYVIAEGRGWRTGPAVAALAAPPTPAFDLARVVQQILRRLSEAVDESAGFVVPEGAAGRVLLSVNARHPLTYAYRTGQLLPLHATSSGKAILAALPPARRAAILGGMQYPAFTPRTITDPVALDTQLRTLGRTGLAYSFEERHLGIIGMARAATIGARLLGAFNVALPSARFSKEAEERIAAALAHATTTLRERAGSGRG
ncbi:IclR family transcriptional regulator [Falsiroseomonas sp. CW058]|uniref:IclR family transcriptional regulator n=1 Tax=Falsiroseomonas sp. CW058 TaxID=3388664 RepID=UPI003D30F340